MGGICGSVLSAFCLELFNPHFNFSLSAFLLLSIFGSSMFMPSYVGETGAQEVSLDILSQDPESTQLDQNHHPTSNQMTLSQNLREIWVHLGDTKIQRTLLYFILEGIMVPTFSDINYYFQINERHFKKSTISLLSILSFFSLFLGTQMFNRFFKNYEFRTTL